MDFFVLPGELEGWIANRLTDPDTWVVAWDIRPCVYTVISRNDRAILSQYGDGEFRGDLQFFLGHRDLASGPAMRPSVDGVQRIDFRTSLCIQIVPPFLLKNILLKGSLATLNPKEYHDIPEENSFLLWRKEAFQSFKKALSGASLVATQQLSNGRVKEWKDIVVSAGALEWFRGGGKLKEFAEGPVEFTIKLSTKNAR